MQILSKLTTAAVLASGVAAQGPSVYISPGSASFVPGTFGTTSDDGSYISAGVANNGNFDDISYASQNGGYAANVGYNNYGGYPGAGFQGGFQGGYQPGFQPGFQGGFPQQQQGLSPPPPPIYQAGTGVSGGNLPQQPGQGLTPPPPPVYQAGTGVSGGNLPSGGAPPLVQVGQPIHTGGFHKSHKRDVKQYPYSPYGSYLGYSGPTVTIGQPAAYFVPGTFGTTFSDGGYTSWGVPSTSYKQRLNKRQTVSASAGPFGPTVTVGQPAAYFVPGTFGTTFADGGYTSWGVAQPQYPYGAAAYYPRPYHSKREVSSESANHIEEATVDGSRSESKPLRNGYRQSGYDSDWSQKARRPNPNAIIQHSNGYESRNPYW